MKPEITTASRPPLGVGHACACRAMTDSPAARRVAAGFALGCMFLLLPALAASAEYHPPASAMQPDPLVSLRNRLAATPPNPVSASSWLSLSLPWGQRDAGAAQRAWESGMGFTTRATAEAGVAERARQAGDLAGYRTHLDRALSLERSAIAQFQAAAGRDYALLDRQYDQLKTVKETAVFAGDVISKFGSPALEKAWGGAKTLGDVIERSGARGFDPLNTKTWSLTPVLGGALDVAAKKGVEQAIGSYMPSVPDLRGAPVKNGATLLSEPMARWGQAAALAGVDALKGAAASAILAPAYNAPPTASPKFTTGVSGSFLSGGLGPGGGVTSSSGGSTSLSGGLSSGGLGLGSAGGLTPGGMGMGSGLGSSIGGGRTGFSGGLSSGGMGMGGSLGMSMGVGMAIGGGFR